MMLHSEFCAVWLSLSDVTGKKNFAHYYSYRTGTRHLNISPRLGELPVHLCIKFAKKIPSSNKDRMSLQFTVFKLSVDVTLDLNRSTYTLRN